MYFCPYCKNILAIENHGNVNCLSCCTCPYLYKISHEIVKREILRTLVVDNVIEGEDEYKYASTCEKKCTKCDNNVALFMELQTRSADEPMTIFYECTKCKANWKEN